MNQIATEIVSELTQKLESLDEQQTAELARIVREAIEKLDSAPIIDPMLGVENGWPVGYFADTVGMFGNEPFERPYQGEHQERDSW